jgi:hypothetical protein
MLCIYKSLGIDPAAVPPREPRSTYFEEMNAANAHQQNYFRRLGEKMHHHQIDGGIIPTPKGGFIKRPSKFTSRTSAIQSSSTSNLKEVLDWPDYVISKVVQEFPSEDWCAPVHHHTQRCIIS